MEAPNNHERTTLLRMRRNGQLKKVAVQGTAAEGSYLKRRSDKPLEQHSAADPRSAGRHRLSTVTWKRPHPRIAQRRQQRFGWRDGPNGPSAHPVFATASESISPSPSKDHSFCQI